MSRSINITRGEAEELVELLEDYDYQTDGTSRIDISAKIRSVFGMKTLEAHEAEYKAWRKYRDEAVRNFTL